MSQLICSFKLILSKCLVVKLGHYARGIFPKSAATIVTFLLSLSVMHSANAITLSQTPLFLGASAKPVLMLAMSRDQELFYSAYPDYSNLDDGKLTMADTTYRNNFDYYGYFDSGWCYDYVKNSTTTGNSYFEPVEKANNHKCNGKWSGNFLNWSSMTRIDVLRKVLYGGKRSVDTQGSISTPAKTVLERSYIPKDSHAFSKTFVSSTSVGNVSDFTPSTESSITLCNVSTSSAATGYPVIRVAKKVWSEWSHTEKTQCQWQENLADSRPTSPGSSNLLYELVAKVSVCEPGVSKDAIGNTYAAADEIGKQKGCKSYEEGSYKPIGVLQKKYADINFGLVMGTWGKNEKGGVLRKKASRLAGNATAGLNEFSETTGVFNTAVTEGIIKDIDLLRITGITFDTSNADASYANTKDWSNPIGEIYAEALRYIIGKKSGTIAFDVDDNISSVIPGLTRVSSTGWDDPVAPSAWCSACSILLISSGPNSYDSLPSAFDVDNGTVNFLSTINSTLTATVLSGKIDAIGGKEFGGSAETTTQNFSDGGTPASQCKTISTTLSKITGICPSAPTTKGSFLVSGLAYWAQTTDVRATDKINNAFAGMQNISTYAVELSEGLPNLNFKLGAGNVSIVPVCTNGTSSKNACSLVGTRVENIEYDSDNNPSKGSMLFYWEDNVAGSDYDMDAVQRISFCIGAACGSSLPSIGDISNKIQITNTLPYWATGTGHMEMGYNISGATNDAIIDNVSTADDERQGLQPTQYVKRDGYTLTGFTSILSDNGGSKLTWFNTIKPLGTDNLPANNPAAKTKNNAAAITNAVYNTTGTFTAASGAAVKLKSPLYYAAKYGYPNAGLAADATPPNYFAMKNPALLERALFKMISDVSERTASGAGISTNSTKIQTDTFVYQAVFNTKDWYGEIKALSGKDNYKQAWTTLGKIKVPSDRKIYSRNPVTKSGFEFKTANWNSLSSDQKIALGEVTTADTPAAQQLLNWVRGEDITGLRKRVELLGDIINSGPLYVGAASQGFDRLDKAYGAADYKEFLKAKASRKDVIYVGSNDGMLHAIDADNGNEVFAYIPSMVFSKFKTIANPAYANSHVYSVDGPVVVSDAYINGSWKTILVGALGAGGSGIFVLDVTDPSKFDQNKILFELSSLESKDIGNVMGKPVIAPVDGKWKIVLGNGYNSINNKANLLIVDLENTNPLTNTVVLQASNDLNNGLSPPALTQNLATGAIEYAYAGDLLGNMWKFNLKPSSSWGLAMGDALFKAIGSDAKSQPIFASPTLGKNAMRNNATMVYFGTGKYIEQDDIETEQMSRVQSYYGIADEGAPVTYLSSNRESSLHKKSFSSTANTRNVDDGAKKDASDVAGVKTVDWVNKQGWYLDFPPGERVISKALLLYDRLIFATVVPSTTKCSFGGSGWLMELVGVGDVYGTSHELMEKNGELLPFFLPGDLIKMTDTNTVINKCDIAGNCEKEVLNDPPSTQANPGRMSWRQLQ